MTGRSVTVAPNIEAFHSKHCPAARHQSPGKCSRKACSYRAKHQGTWSPRFPTMAEAKEWKRGKVRDGAAQRTAGPTPSITLLAAWEAWVDAAESGRIHSRSGARYKPVTLRDYKESMAKRVLPDYGGNPLVDVTPRGLKSLVADFREQGLSASAIRNTINPVRALFRDADEVVAGWTGADPTAGLRLPKVTSRRQPERIPTPEQAARLVKHASERDRAIWATACYAGLRRGELRALRRKDIDLESRRLRVRRSWDRVEREIEPKSDAGKREVPIIALLLPILQSHLRSMRHKTPDALVFGTSTGGPFDPGDVSRRAAKAWKDKCEAFTLHECRHGFASVCIEATVNAKRIQTWMGHSSITTTFDLYGRLLDRSEADSVSMVDDYLAMGPAVGPLGAASSGKQRKSRARPPRAARAVGAPTLAS